MKICHQSFNVLRDLPIYADAMSLHTLKVVVKDTEVVMHGQLTGTNLRNYPGSDLGLAGLYNRHQFNNIRYFEQFDTHYITTASQKLPNEALLGHLFAMRPSFACRARS